MTKSCKLNFGSDRSYKRSGFAALDNLLKFDSYRRWNAYDVFGFAKERVACFAVRIIMGETIVFCCLTSSPGLTVLALRAWSGKLRYRY